MYSLTHLRNLSYDHMKVTYGDLINYKAPYSLIKAIYYIECASLLLCVTQKFITRPNFVTLLYIFTGVLGSFLLNLDSKVGVCVGIFLVFNKGVFDWWDGRLARLLNKVSNKGGILDPYGARVCDGAFRISVLYYALVNNMDWMFLYPLAVFLVLVPNVRFYAKATTQTHGEDVFSTVAVANFGWGENAEKWYRNYLCFLDGRARSVDAILLLILIDVLSSYELDFMILVLALMLVIRATVEFFINLFVFLVIEKH